MDIADILTMGAKLFINSDRSGEAGSSLDIGGVASAIAGLMGGGGAKPGLDLGTLVSMMGAKGLGATAQSWLGDGGNDPISPEEITDTLGAGNISAFASRLGLSEAEAAGGLSEALPQMVDKASRGGSLLDSIGGVSGAMGLAGKLFGQ
jgi:uncharacterized protein YidB (DUF937 family)